MILRHILVKHEYEANDLLRKLEISEKVADGVTPADAFADLASKFSTCGTREVGGSLGNLEGRMNRLDDDFREAAQKLQIGERTGAVRTKFGYHLIFREG